jgi:hypothetical protein
MARIFQHSLTHMPGTAPLTSTRFKLDLRPRRGSPIGDRLKRTDRNAPFLEQRKVLLALAVMAFDDHAATQVVREIDYLVALGRRELPSSKFTDYRRIFCANILAGKYKTPVMQRLLLQIITDRLTQ